jgi:hypothetical protein
LAGIFITFVNANAAAVNSYIEANTEILRHERSHTVGLEHLVALHKSTHGHASVNYLGLSHQNTLVFKEVIHVEVVNTVILNTILNDGLFEIAVEA